MGFTLQKNNWSQLGQIDLERTIERAKAFLWIQNYKFHTPIFGFSGFGNIRN